MKQNETTSRELEAMNDSNEQLIEDIENNTNTVNEAEGTTAERDIKGLTDYDTSSMSEADKLELAKTYAGLKNQLDENKKRSAYDKEEFANQSLMEDDYQVYSQTAIAETESSEVQEDGTTRLSYTLFYMNEDNSKMIARKYVISELFGGAEQFVCYYKVLENSKKDNKIYGALADELIDALGLEMTPTIVSPTLIMVEIEGFTTDDGDYLKAVQYAPILKKVKRAFNKGSKK